MAVGNIHKPFHNFVCLTHTHTHTHTHAHTHTHTYTHTHTHTHTHGFHLWAALLPELSRSIFGSIRIWNTISLYTFQPATFKLLLTHSCTTFCNYRVWMCIYSGNVIKQSKLFEYQACHHKGYSSLEDIEIFFSFWIIDSSRFGVITT